jgi:hypothetical protein
MIEIRLETKLINLIHNKEENKVLGVEVEGKDGKK